MAVAQPRSRHVELVRPLRQLCDSRAMGLVIDMNRQPLFQVTVEVVDGRHLRLGLSSLPLFRILPASLPVFCRERELTEAPGVVNLCLKIQWRRLQAQTPNTGNCSAD